MALAPITTINHQNPYHGISVDCDGNVFYSPVLEDEASILKEFLIMKGIEEEFERYKEDRQKIENIK